jgi:uncharacterized membrane protein YkvA (DUF1232 family)
MHLLERLKSVRLSLKREITLYRIVSRHPRTPRSARILLGAALGYLLLPFDLIPDFIPVLGHLDDAVLVPGLLYCALRLIPAGVIEECRQQALSARKNDEKE